MNTDVVRKDALTVQCPECGSLPGIDCLGVNVANGGIGHKWRYMLSQERLRPGPHVFGGKLFWRMRDRSLISCECIGEPYASQIVCEYREAAWR